MNNDDLEIIHMPEEEQDNNDTDIEENILFESVKIELQDEEESKTEASEGAILDEAVADNKKRKDDEEFSLGKEIFSWVKMIVIAFLVALFIDKVIIVNATVPTGSMENTIMTGSRMIGFRFSYWFSNPERGDVVVFKYPLDEKQNYVKRVIGLPGEVVVIKEAKVYIYEDGDKTKEPLVLEEDYLKENWVSRNDGYEFTIPEDSYLMMGDNRNNSADARVWYEQIQWQNKQIDAYNEEIEEHNRNYPDDQMTLKEKQDINIIYVKKDKVLGKAVCTYWPLNNMGIIK